jgi:hypothetical protein
VTGVTWTELPPDAPEPPPLSVVRDRVNRWWVGDYATYEGARHWLLVGDDIVTTWAALTKEDAPLSLGQPEGRLLRRVESVEPSPYEVRHAALTAAVQLYYGERDDPAEVLGAARAFEPYLRGDGPGHEATDESAGTDAAWYQARENAERAETYGP